MGIIVQKYGGTSVATPARLRRVAGRIAQTLEDPECVGVAVVVSAMGHSTDRLIDLAHRITPAPDSREMDMLLSTGEMVTAPLLAMALQARGVPAISLTGLQAGIRTTGRHRHARISEIRPERLVDTIYSGRVVIVTGFQGATAELDISTLGRGGSDTTAVALAVALGGDHCEIYTDVAGVFTADPRVVPDARPLAGISYDEMLEMASVGAVVMHPRAVEIGAAYSLPIWVRSTFGSGPGTIINGEANVEGRQPVRGIAHRTDVAKVTLVGVPDRPGVASAVFGPLADHGVNIDIVVQNVSHDGFTDLSFTIAEADLGMARLVLEQVATDVGAAGYQATADIGKVTAVGTGLLNIPGMFATACRALADAGINIQMMSTSEIRITFVVDRGRVIDAVRALHRIFALEKL